MRKKEEKLTELHFKVYEAIKASTEYGNPIDQRSLCEACGLPYKEETTNSSNGKGDHCRNLWTIVKEINESLEIDEIGVVDDYTYRIGTEEETKEYRNYLMKKLRKLVRRVQVIDKKMARNGKSFLVDETYGRLDLGNHEEEHKAYAGKGNDA